MGTSEIPNYDYMGEWGKYAALLEMGAVAFGECSRTDGGWRQVIFGDYDGRTCIVAESSLILKHLFGQQQPGSGALFLVAYPLPPDDTLPEFPVGTPPETAKPEHMLLSRGHVMKLVELMQHWLDTGSLPTEPLGTKKEGKRT